MFKIPFQLLLHTWQLLFGFSYHDKKEFLLGWVCFMFQTHLLWHRPAPKLKQWAASPSFALPQLTFSSFCPTHKFTTYLD